MDPTPSFDRLAVALATLACLLTAGCGSELKAVTYTGPAQACRTADGPAPAQCRLMGDDADWLPPAYVTNASCRCQATPSSPSANCVRGKLEAFVLETPDGIREEWRRQKAELYDTGKQQQYDAWLYANAGREIHRWHREAHAGCCCAAELPPYDQWWSTVSVPFESCTRSRVLADFGSCRGGKTRW